MWRSSRRPFADRTRGDDLLPLPPGVRGEGGRVPGTLWVWWRLGGDDLIEFRLALLGRIGDLGGGVGTVLDDVRQGGHLDRVHRTGVLRRQDTAVLTEEPNRF